MEKHKFNHLISVDSETGIYRDGDRVLRARALIDAAINQAVDKQAGTQNYATRGQALLHYAAMKIIRTTASCFGSRSFLFM